MSKVEIYGHSCVKRAKDGKLTFECYEFRGRMILCAVDEFYVQVKWCPFCGFSIKDVKEIDKVFEDDIGYWGYLLEVFEDDIGYWGCVDGGKCQSIEIPMFMLEELLNKPDHLVAEQLRKWYEYGQKTDQEREDLKKG